MNNILVAVLLHAAFTVGTDLQPKEGRLNATKAFIASEFGNRTDPFTKEKRFHAGVDIAAVAGSKIRPVAAGIVAFSGEYAGYGKVVVIDHGNFIRSIYAHCWETKVAVGELVSNSTTIAYVGQTGRTTGSHVHMEVRFRSIPIDPQWVVNPVELINE
jgi:murein DD-endopeptidase MepM/ murein hydrolase activator NlpD